VKQATLPLSAVIITRNEEANIERCLKSLQFCDQIILVDSGSTDKTVEIAKIYTGEVYVRPWAGFAKQKNEAALLAKNKWILSVDADEVVPPSLQAEIKGLFESGKYALYGAFSMPRKTVHFGRWIRYGGWYPNRLVRLFNRETGNWEGAELHESWVSSGAIGLLREPLEHYSFSSLEDQVARNNRYSSLGALKLQREGKRFKWLRLLTKPTSKFLETYFLKRGFLDGYPGLIISISAAYSVFLKWAKLWELQNAREKI
jgi:glycosyltransferase involved in cell wall biosynthesis